MKTYLAIAAGVFLLFTNVIAGSNIENSELLGRIEQHQSPIIIDTRTQWEYASGHIPGAINIPFHAKWQNIPALAPKKGDEIVLYYAHGPRANFALKRMEKAGFTNVRHLQGDMQHWKQQGLPIEK